MHQPKKSPSISVGARVAWSGAVGLYGRPWGGAGQTRPSSIDISRQPTARDRKGLRWRMTFLVEWCVTRVFSLMSFAGILPSQLAEQDLSCISRDIPLRVSSGLGWVGCSRGLQYFSLSPAKSKGPPHVLTTALAPTESSIGA